MTGVLTEYSISQSTQSQTVHAILHLKDFLNGVQWRTVMAKLHYKSVLTILADPTRVVITMPVWN